MKWPVMLNDTVIFRATDELAEAIRHRASEAQMTVSEYLRSIITELVGGRDVVSPTCANIARSAFANGDQWPYQTTPLGEGFASPDPFALLACAGEGDIGVQRELADMAINVTIAGGPECDPFVVLSEGLIFARMADRVGEADDAMRVVTMLALLSTLACGQAARDIAAEAIARLEMIANGASDHAEHAATLLASHAQGEQPETMRLAQEYRDRLGAQCDGVNQVIGQ